MRITPQNPQQSAGKVHISLPDDAVHGLVRSEWAHTASGPRWPRPEVRDRCHPQAVLPDIGQNPAQRFCAFVLSPDYCSSRSTSSFDSWDRQISRYTLAVSQQLLSGFPGPPCARRPAPGCWSACLMEAARWDTMNTVMLPVISADGLPQPGIRGESPGPRRCRPGSGYPACAPAPWRWSDAGCWPPERFLPLLAR